jgi:hypothetical protein
MMGLLQWRTITPLIQLGLLEILHLCNVEVFSIFLRTPVIQLRQDTPHTPIQNALKDPTFPRFQVYRSHGTMPKGC